MPIRRVGAIDRRAQHNAMPQDPLMDKHAKAALSATKNLHKRIQDLEDEMGETDRCYPNFKELKKLAADANKAIQAMQRHASDDAVRADVRENILREAVRDELIDRAAKAIADGNVLGWFNGRMEFGPRALGSRSILGDPRSPEMQKKMNLKIKFRESFRPFAPSVLEHRASDYFELDAESPYMLLVSPVREDRRVAMTEDQKGLFGIEKLNVPRSDVPAITHVDYSARVQTVSRERSPDYFDLISKFEEHSGCPLVVNTSFNVRGEPIVCTPEDAYVCFMRTDMDFLVLDSFFLEKTEQPELEEEGDWRDEFELD